MEEVSRCHLYKGELCWLGTHTRWVHRSHEEEDHYDRGYCRCPRSSTSVSGQSDGAAGIDDEEEVGFDDRCNGSRNESADGEDDQTV